MSASAIFLYSDMSPADQGLVDKVEDILRDLDVQHGPITLDGGISFELKGFRDKMVASSAARLVSAKLARVGVKHAVEGARIILH